MDNSALNALSTKKAKGKVNKNSKVIFVQVDNDVYSEIMTKRGRLQTEAGESISITDFVLKAIEVFNAE
jgi:hypothetical protein